jgi:hypothetical protein
VRLRHCGTGVGARGVFGIELHLPAKYPALGVDLADRELTTDLLVAAQLRIRAGERIVEPDLDRLFGQALDDKRTRNLHRADGETGFEQRATSQVWIQKMACAFSGHGRPSFGPCYPRARVKLAVTDAIASRLQNGALRRLCTACSINST